MKAFSFLFSLALSLPLLARAEAPADPIPAGEARQVVVLQANPQWQEPAGLMAVARSLEATPGIEAVELQTGRGRMRITYRPQLVTLPAIVQTVERTHFRTGSSWSLERN